MERLTGSVAVLAVAVGFQDRMCPQGPGLRAQPGVQPDIDLQNLTEQALAPVIFHFFFLLFLSSFLFFFCFSSLEKFTFLGTNRLMKSLRPIRLGHSK